MRGTERLTHTDTSLDLGLLYAPNRSQIGLVWALAMACLCVQAFEKSLFSTLFEY